MSTTIQKKDGEKYTDVKIIRGESGHIILPKDMTYAEGRTWLTRQEEAEEKTVNIYDEIPCFPLDGIVALMWALKERYGFAALADTPGFFGSTPPLLVQVPLHDGKFETAPIGRIQPLGWEGGSLDTIVQREAALKLTGTIKRKHEQEVKAIITAARERVATHSIYKGHAVRVDLEFMVNPNRKFDPIKDAPQFIDLSRVDPKMLILNKQTEYDLAVNIWTLIERSEDCRRNSIPLKHGCLLKGPFGTGKTMTAHVTAQKCVQNNWTFIYLKNAMQLAAALRVAELYAPSVVFSEDIDAAISADRDTQLNELLNTLDGVDTKGKPIITVLTTNNPHLIHSSFLRAGRIDTVVDMGLPEAETAQRFVQLYARDEQGRTLLSKDVNLEVVGSAMQGFVPAFISEAVQKAKRFTIYRVGDDICGNITTEDLVGAANALRHHVDMVSGRKTESRQDTVAKSLENIWSYQADGEVRHRFESANGGGVTTAAKVSAQ